MIGLLGIWLLHQFTGFFNQRFFRKLNVSLEKEHTPWWIAAITSFVVVVIIKWAWPEAIPFQLFEFWFMDITWSQFFKIAWIPFAWVAGMTAVGSYFTKNDPKVNARAEQILEEGFWVSLRAGVLEEVAFRWVFFYEQIPIYLAVDWLFFGWNDGLGWLQWWHLHVDGPLANWTTLGYLEPILLGQAFGWAVGAALLTSNGRFRNGHLYLGPVGFVNSWFLGMYFFYLMFHHGLWLAIIVHFVYDLLHFGVRYIDAATERAMGLTYRSRL